jgi:ankyrin repeat protein
VGVPRSLRPTVRTLFLFVSALALLSPGAEAGKKEDEALLEASLKGRISEVRTLLRQGAEVNSRNESGTTPLISACIGGHVDVARELLRAGADANLLTHSGKTALEAAASKESVPLVQALIAGGADPRRLPDRGTRLLDEAAGGGRSGRELVRLLLAAGAESSLFGDRALLDRLAQAGNRELLEALLDQGARKRVPGQALRVVILEKDLALTQALVRAGIPVNGETRDHSTPLLTSISMKTSDITRFLVESGADVNQPGSYGVTPLVGAVKYDYDSPEIAELLLARGAEVDLVPPSPGLTALGAAAEEGEIELVRLFLRHGAKVDLEDVNHMTPLERATSSGHEEVVSELLARGSRIEKEAGAVPESHPIFTAVDSCEVESLRLLLAAGGDPNLAPVAKLGSCPPEVAEILVEAGLDINRRDSKGETALLEAARHKSPETTRGLLALGADVNATGPQGATPLHRASSMDSNEKTVEVLLAHGADVQARDSSGQTALHRASVAAAPRTLILLLAAGADPEAKDASGRPPAALYGEALEVPTAPETANRDGVHLRFTPPAGFQHCGTPSQGEIIVQCTSDSLERIVKLDIRRLGEDAAASSFDLRTLAQGDGVTLSYETWNGKKIPVVRYLPDVDHMEGFSHPVRWMALIPWDPAPLLVRVSSESKYEVELGWMLLRTVRSITELPDGEGPATSEPGAAIGTAIGGLPWTTLAVALTVLLLIAAAAGIMILRRRSRPVVYRGGPRPPGAP